MNAFFGLVKDNEIISSIRYRDFDLKDMFEAYQKEHGRCDDNTHKFIYNTDFKQYVDNNIIMDLVNNCNDAQYDDVIDFKEYEVRVLSSYDFRNLNEDYKNECEFLEHIKSAKSEDDKQLRITPEMLQDFGFERMDDEHEREYYKRSLHIDNYSSWRRWTDDFDKKDKALKLDISYGSTNYGEWNLHIDNLTCESIASVDIENVWQFNMMMEIYGSNFRL